MPGQNENHTKTSRLRTATVNVALVATSMLLMLGLGEMAARVAAPEWLAFRMQMLQEGAHAEQVQVGTDRAWPVERRDGRFYRFKPGAAFSVVHREYQHRVRIDPLGARATRRRDVGHAGAGKAIPVLGDSFTFGIGVRDDETYLSRLAEDVSARIVNLGVPGTALSQQLRILSMRHEDLGRPQKALFVVFLGNDLTDEIRADARRKKAGREATERSEPDRWLWRINAWTHDIALLRGSYFLQLIKQRLLSLRNRGALRDADPYYLTAQAGSPALERGADILSNVFDELEREAARLGIRPSFVLIPDRNQISERRRARMLAYYGIDDRELDLYAVNRLYATQAAARGWPVYDATACLAADAEPDRLYYMHDDHLTPAGHAVLAVCMRTRLGDLIGSDVMRPSEPLPASSVSHSD